MEPSLRRSRLGQYSEKWPIIIGCYTSLIVIGLTLNLLIGGMYKVDRPNVANNGTQYTVNAILSDPLGQVMVQVESGGSEILLQYVGYGFDGSVKPVESKFADKLTVKGKQVIFHSYFHR